MVKPKCDPPTPKFPFKIPKRLNILSVPRKYVYETDEGMPTYTPRGIRKSALGNHASDRIVDVAWPYLRRLLLQKRAYKNMFSQERVERIDRMIELSNATCYSKLANCVIDLKKQDTKEVKKKKGWSESEWKKHMEYIGQIAGPKKMFEPPPVMRGKRMKLEALMARINQMSYLPDYKCHRRLSQEPWYRNPLKVSPSAMKYVISERVKKLATPRALPPAD